MPGETGIHKLQLNSKRCIAAPRQKLDDIVRPHHYRRRIVIRVKPYLGQLHKHTIEHDLYTFLLAHAHSKYRDSARRHPYYFLDIVERHKFKPPCAQRARKPFKVEPLLTAHSDHIYHPTLRVGQQQALGDRQPSELRRVVTDVVHRSVLYQPVRGTCCSKPL